MPCMRRLWQFIKRYSLLPPLLLVTVLLIFGLVSWIASIGISRPGVRLVPVTSRPAPPLPGTPVARFAPLDSALVPFLENIQPSYGAAPLDGLGLAVQPVGAYLPRDGNVQFELREPTPSPTPLPYPTSPPLPLPTVPQQILPTPLTPVPIPTVPLLADNGTPRTLDYGGDNCAPGGNPVEGILSQRYHSAHPGIDIAVPLGTPVIATHSGQVTFAGWSEVGYGYLVILQNGAFITYYAHNTSFNVTQGQFVGKNSILAWAGSTGNSTGPHVHYETRINDVPVDPLTFENRGYGTC